MTYYEANGWIPHVQGSAASGRQDLRNWLGQQIDGGEFNRHQVHHHNGTLCRWSHQSRYLPRIQGATFRFITSNNGCTIFPRSPSRGHTTIQPAGCLSGYARTRPFAIRKRCSASPWTTPRLFAIIAPHPHKKRITGHMMLSGYCRRPSRN